MSMPGNHELWTKHDNILTWTSPATYLYLPTAPGMSLLRASIYLEDGFPAADVEAGIIVKCQKFTGATYTSGSWTGGAWSDLFELDLTLIWDTSSRILGGLLKDELRPETFFMTKVKPVPDPLKRGGSLMNPANTHTASPVAGETDLRISVSADPATGISSGTEIGVGVIAIMGL